MKKILFIALIVSRCFGGLPCLYHSRSKTPTVMPAKAYSATVMLRATAAISQRADVTVDPNNSENPIKVNSLDMVNIGDTTSYKTHDARIDANDSNTLFLSTYVLDKAGKMHVGKSDLKTGKSNKGVAMDP